MCENKDFIKVHALVDGCVCFIRHDLIEGVFEFNEEELGYGVKPAHTNIDYAGKTLDVTESYEEVMDMIWKAGL